MLAEGPTPEETARVDEHFRYLRDLASRGVVLLAGRTLTTDETAFGVVVLRADSEETARSIMEADPAVRAGVMRARLFPFRLALVGEELIAGGVVPAAEDS